jgi:GTPase SAR1 family protein
VVLVYDITNRDSYNNIIKWLDETKNYANDKVIVVLVGNKTDLDSKYI